MRYREHDKGGALLSSVNMSCLLCSAVLSADGWWQQMGNAARKEAEKKFPGKVKGLSQVRAICHKDGQGTFCDHTYSDCCA